MKATIAGRAKTIVLTSTAVTSSLFLELLPDHGPDKPSSFSTTCALENAVGKLAHCLVYA